jgi:hypothetical protein
MDYGLPKYRRRTEADGRPRGIWANIGSLVSSPAAVVDFQLPYCREVLPTEAGLISDRLLGGRGGNRANFRAVHPCPVVSDAIFLTGAFDRRDFGIPEAVRLKFNLVKEGSKRAGTA